MVKEFFLSIEELGHGHDDQENSQLHFQAQNGGQEVDN
jgi:hypothetical protein